MSSLLIRLSCLASAGALGTLARYGLSVLVRTYFPSTFPWSTWAVNITGCFLFGLGLYLAKQLTHLQDDIQLVLLIGFMGAFTTFSTYIFELALQAEAGDYLHLILNITGQNLLGVAALFLGLRVGKMLSSLSILLP